MVESGLQDVGEKDVHSLAHSQSLDADLRQSISVKQSWLCQVCVSCLHNLIPTGIFGGSCKIEARVHHGKVFAMLASSSLLTEEDAFFLQDLAAERQSAQTPTQKARGMPGAPVITLFTICLLTSALTPWFPPTLSLWVPLTSTALLALLLPAVLARGVGVWQGRRTQRQAEGLKESIKGFLVEAAKCTDTASKCVRFIQESELVARGFTFVGQTGSNRALRELQVGPRQRQCTGLRQQLFVISRAFFVTLRHSFAQLTELCPVGVEVGGVTHYCSEIPLSQYPQMMQQELSSDQDSMATLYNLTDGFSVDVLKSMQALNGIHVSEFLRRMAVCFVQQDKDFDLYTSLPALLGSVTHDLRKLHSDLQSHLNAHRRSSLSADMRKQKISAWQPPTKFSQLRQTYTAVHSLELHLMAALKKIQDLSQTIETKLEEEAKPCVSGKATSHHSPEDPIEESCREAWSQMLCVVRSEIAACSGCLEEGAKQLEKADTNVSPLPETQAKSPVTTSSSEVKVVTVSAKDNPIILDEVFEAYSEPQELDEWGHHSQLALSEEEVWQKRQKKNLKLCLNELQSIIDTRAVERQEREKIAMERMKTLLAATDSSLQEENNRKCDIDAETGLHKEPGKENSQGVEEDGADDLMKDIEERVEFWKQFDQKQNVVSVSEGNISSSDVNEYEFCVEENARSDENEHTVSGQAVGRVSASVYGESDTECVDRNTSNTCLMREINSSQCSATSEPDDIHFMSSMTTHHRTPDADCLYANGTETAASLEEKVHRYKENTLQDRTETHITGTEEEHTPALNSNSPEGRDGTELIIGTGALRSGNKTWHDETEPQLTANQHSTDVLHPGASLTGLNVLSRGRERTEVEGVLEHLSLPGTPSPFAFSIASMVALRARDMARTEDTFGDSSSDGDDDDGEDRKDGEVEEESLE